MPVILNWSRSLSWRRSRSSSAARFWPEAETEQAAVFTNFSTTNFIWSAGRLFNLVLSNNPHLGKSGNDSWSIPNLVLFYLWIVVNLVLVIYLCMLSTIFAKSGLLYYRETDSKSGLNPGPDPDVASDRPCKKYPYFGPIPTTLPHSFPTIIIIINSWMHDGCY